MSAISVFPHRSLLNPCATGRSIGKLSCFTRRHRFCVKESINAHVSLLFRNRISCCFKREDKENCEVSKSINEDGVHISVEEGHNKVEVSFAVIIAIAMGIAVIATIVSISRKPILGSSFSLQIVSEGSSSSAVAPATAGFAFNFFGYRVILPEYPPGCIYFWLLMAAGCGLFISEEALNIWVGISIARLLSLDGTWQSFSESFSRNASYILSTLLWVYWGVCISDLIPFYFGKLFRQAGVSDDVSSRLGIGKEKAVEITGLVRKYGNLIGFVERFSLGVRNPTAFLAGALGISPECFFAGVCCGGLFTLPIQLGVGFLLRERPIFALATVATVVGIWTFFPYVVAASTALFFYLRGRYFS